MALDWNTDADSATINRIGVEIYLVVWLPAIVLFVYRRKRFPLKQRYPYLVLGYNSAIALFSVAQSDRLPCFIYFEILTPTLPLSIFCLAVRCWMLVMSFELELDLNQHSLLGNERWTPSWFTKHFHWMRKSFVTKVALAIHLPLLLLPVCLLPLVLDQQDNFLSDCTATTTWPNWSIIAMLIAMLPNLALIAAMACRLRRYEKDGFSIKKEFVQLALSTLFCFLGFIIVFLINIGGNAKYVLYTMLLCLNGISGAIITMVIPVTASYRYQQLQREFRHKAQSMTLEQLLTLPQGFEALLRFMQSEFCSELLLFYKRVEEYKTQFASSADSGNPAQSNTNQPQSASSPAALSSSTPLSALRVFEPTQLRELIDARLQEARTIFDTYLTVDSPFEVNLGSNERALLLRKLARVEATLRDTYSKPEHQLHRKTSKERTSLNKPSSSSTQVGDSPLVSPHSAQSQQQHHQHQHHQQQQQQPDIESSPIPNTPGSDDHDHSQSANARKYREPSSVRLLPSPDLHSDAIGIDRQHSNASPSQQRAEAQTPSLTEVSQNSGQVIKAVSIPRSNRARSSSLPVASVAVPLNSSERILDDLCHLFDEGQNAVLHLIQTNSFSRFRASKQFDQLVESFGSPTLGSGFIRVRTVHRSHHVVHSADSLGSDLSGTGIAFGLGSKLSQIREVSKEADLVSSSQSPAPAATASSNERC